MSAFFLHHPKETDLALFAGGESGPLSRWRVERHIEGCADCKAAVTDYFHLTEELQPLAELPDLNWDAMALGIERRLAAEERVEAPQRAVPAMAWAASLAAVAVICGIVVVRQQPSSAPAEMAAIEMESAAQVSDLDSANRLDQEERAMPMESAPPVMEAKAKAAPEAEPPASEPEQIARLEKREMSGLDRSAPALADEMAPAPPPPPLGLRAAAAPPAAWGSVLGEAATRNRAPMRAGRQATASKEAASSVALDIQPLFEQGSDVRVAADGWISVRSISAEGRVTITDVYAP